ncbi:hypothetical protein UFOVP523_1 [uncultured Caudovirales phage]|uniref:Uncharacterized protein n=1 Tax=uncultured Caudovirales phage TaxID=2100421 RepID=A0A6J5MTX1_9CAUD|nr:hypothetical protein UFOVP523_1 [uncultured Caudovirales phage]
MALEKRISELTAKSGIIEDTDLLVISDYNGATYDTKKVTGAQLKPYKNYLANITQVTTGDPNINASYSDLSGNLTFTRNATGTYYITNSVAEFTAFKTLVFHTSGLTPFVRFQYQVSSTTLIILYTYNSSDVLTDGLLNASSLEIKIIK